MPSCKLAVYQMPGQIVWRDGAYRVGDIAICSSSDDADARSLPGDWYWTAADGHMPVGPFPDRDSALAHGTRACLAYGKTELVDSVSKLASYVGPDEKGRFIHNCWCGQWASYGFNVDLRHGRLGQWYCAEHRPKSSADSANGRRTEGGSQQRPGVNAK